MPLPLPCETGRRSSSSLAEVLQCCVRACFAAAAARLADWLAFDARQASSAQSAERRATTRRCKILRCHSCARRLGRRSGGSVELQPARCRRGFFELWLAAAAAAGATHRGAPPSRPPPPLARAGCRSLRAAHSRASVLASPQTSGPLPDAHAHPPTKPRLPWHLSWACAG